MLTPNYSGRNANYGYQSAEPNKVVVDTPRNAHRICNISF